MTQRKNKNKNANIQTAIFKIVEDIDINKVKKKLKDKGYEEKKIDDKIKTKFNNYNFDLYCISKEIEPAWKKFTRNLVKKTEEKRENKRKVEGFVFLISKEDKKDKKKFFYVFTGGIGYFAIKEFIDQSFGIEILEKLLEPSFKTIKSVKDKNIVSNNLIGSSKYFRGLNALYDTEEFGSIYQELTVKLTDEFFEKFKEIINKTSDKFSTTFNKTYVENISKKLKNSHCIAKSSFKIQKSMELKEILLIIESLHSITKQPSNKVNFINSMHPVKDKGRIEELNGELWKKLCAKKEPLKFTICHKDIEEFWNAEKYTLIKEKKKDGNRKEDFNIDKIKQKIKKQIKQYKEQEIPNKGQQKDENWKILKNWKIVTFDSENNQLTTGSIYEHLICEISYNKKNYFMINGDWYYLVDNFVKNLNERCKNLINEHWINASKIFDGEKWKRKKKGKKEGNLEDEKEFNKRFKDKKKFKNFIVLDRKITKENIELCDILKYDNNKTYLIHVKKGFDQNMRDLCAQIYISAKRVYQTLKGQGSKTDFLGKFYDKLSKNKSSETEIGNIGRDAFIKLFKPEKIIFVAAIVDKSSPNTQRKINKNIKEFKSNTAKFSLCNLLRDMKNIGMNLKITQIEVEQNNTSPRPKRTKQKNKNNA